jgi:hypothetical protein
VLFQETTFPQDIIGYINWYYFRVTRPLVAISSGFVAIMLRGELSVWEYHPAKELACDEGTETWFTEEYYSRLTLDITCLGSSIQWRDARAISCSMGYVDVIVGDAIYEIDHEIKCKARQINMPIPGDVISVACGSAHSAAIIAMSWFEQQTSRFACIVSCASPFAKSVGTAHDRGTDHPAAAGQDPHHHFHLVLWGANYCGQLGRKDIRASEPAWAGSGNSLSVVCLKTATMVLVDGEIWYCGSFGPNTQEIHQFTKITMPGTLPIRSIEMLYHRVLFRDDNRTYVALEANRGPFNISAMIERPLTYDREMIEMIFNEDRVAFIDPRELMINSIDVCEWSVLGGR